jgi:ABC-type branched-subunit amino acid transport system ATPase component
MSSKTQPAPAAFTDVLLDARNVAKSFGAVRALTDASLTVRRGEVVALMGANGAGKSTFVKILTGAIRPDAGRVTIRGAEARVGSPAEARRSGLVPVYQEPSLIPDLDVADNLRLGDTDAETFRHWTAELGHPELKLDAMIRDLPLATLRIIDLARALASTPDVLLLDELTAALPTDLVERVLRVARQQAEDGRGVIYISHRFAEIAELCDRATVLRDGRSVGDAEIAPGVEDRLVEMMLGARIDLGKQAAETARPRPAGQPRLRVQNLAAAPKLTDASFELHPGEVLGVVALEGQGQDELFEVLAGFRKPAAGSIEVDGAPAQFRHPADAIAAGHDLRSRQPGRGAVPRTLRAGEHGDALFRPPAQLGPLAPAPRKGARGRGGRAASDRHPRAGRGAAAFGRQPAEGDDRALARSRGADAASVRPDARDRRADEAADLPAGPRTWPNRGRRSSITPRNSTRCRWPATGPWSSSMAASSTSWRRRRRPRNA